MSEGPTSERRLLYADTRAYALPETLEELTGPTSGPVDLPPTIVWSERSHYELDDPYDVRIMYERVVREAPRPADLQRYLNSSLLVTVWRRLFLPRRVVAMWEERFPELLHAV